MFTPPAYQGKKSPDLCLHMYSLLLPKSLWLCFLLAQEAPGMPMAEQKSELGFPGSKPPMLATVMVLLAYEGSPLVLHAIIIYLQDLGRWQWE